jgi:hypothetical protein
MKTLPIVGAVHGGGTCFGFWLGRCRLNTLVLFPSQKLRWHWYAFAKATGG